MAMPGNRSFVLISGMGRSGTTLLQRSILQLPHITGPDFEITDALFSQGIKLVVHDADERLIQKSMKKFVCFLVDPEKWQQDRVGVLKHTSNSFSGTKLTLSRALSLVPNSKLILVRRQDPLEKIASHLCAVRSGTWHVSSKENLPENYYSPMTIPFWVFLRYAEEHIRIMKFYEELKLREDVLCLDYNSRFEENFGEWIEKVAIFLGVGSGLAENIVLPTKKMAPPVEAYVRNHEELRREFVNMERRFERYAAPLTHYQISKIEIMLRLRGIKNRALRNNDIF